MLAQWLAPPGNRMYTLYAKDQLLHTVGLVLDGSIRFMIDSAENASWPTDRLFNFVYFVTCFNMILLNARTSSI